MSDDLRNRVARAIANVREGGWPADTYALLQQHYLTMAEAALAEIGEPVTVNDDMGICGSCMGSGYGVADQICSACDGDGADSSEPAPVSVRHEGPDMKLARDAYSMGSRDGLEGIRVSDPRVILSRLRAIAEGKD